MLSLAIALMTPEKPMWDKGARAALKDSGEHQALPLDDVTLLRSIAAQDRSALAELYDRYAQRLLALARRLMNNPLDAEDLLHDVFIEVWQKAASYDSERASVACWLILRLRSRALDRLRSPSYRRVIAVGSSPSEVVGARELHSDPLANLDAMSGALQQALLALPADTQTILDLVYFKGLSLPEVAAKMDMPLGTVKSRLHRALHALRLAAGRDPEDREA